MAYVYRHIRLDKNEPFYIGVGTNPSAKREYQRSKRRSNIWNNIANKTKYDVEIMIDGLTIEEAYEKEKEFIKLYGRIDLKTGTLCNLTDGGGGAINLVVSDETRRKLSHRLKGRVITEEMREKISKTLKGNKVSEKTKAKISLSTKGKVFADDHRRKINEKVSRPVYLCDKDGNNIKYFETIRKAAKELNLKPPMISMVVRGIRKKTLGMYFKYA